MKKFTDLLLFEINRIKKAYLMLIGLIVSLQIVANIWASNNFMRMYKNHVKETRGSMNDFLENWGKFDFFQVQNHFIFELSIMLGIFALVLYVFVIWYRDWIGKNNLSYRFLTLPGSRMNIFYAKLACILFLIGGLLATQIVMLYLGEMLTGILLPDEMFETLRFLGQPAKNEVIGLILPSRILDFVLHYTVGIAILVAVNLMIVLRLSFKWKGFAMGIAVIGILLALFIAVLLSGWLDYIFPIEQLALTILFSVLVTVGSLLASHYLMNNKISV